MIHRCFSASHRRAWAAPALRTGAVLALTAALSGCALMRAKKDRTTIITPSMRAATIRQLGEQAGDYTEAQQIALSEQLAQQIRIEPDPIVRQTIQVAISECKTPLAQAVLLAGLNDDDREVRITCCRLLGHRADPAAVAALSRIVATDPEADVRVAATDALGGIRGTGSVQGIAAALRDRDPAMQYAGVEAMKRASGQDLGNDVAAWRQYADSLAPADLPAASIAQQPQDPSGPQTSPNGQPTGPAGAMPASNPGPQPPFRR
jgi:HEAT repeat protein